MVTELILGLVVFYMAWLTFYCLELRRRARATRNWADLELAKRSIELLESRLETREAVRALAACRQRSERQDKEVER